MASENQIRVFSQVLAIDAWHKPINALRVPSPVHVELSFHEGRIGGDDPTIPFTFRVRLKRALLTVKVEEPLQIDRGSVARAIPKDVVERTRVLKATDVAKRSAVMGASINPAKLALAASGKLSANTEQTKEEELRWVQKVPRIIALPSPRSRSEYCWELIPGHYETLEGQPWNPVLEPRLSILSLLTQPRVSPAVKVLVSCKLSDIFIDDLVLKDSSTLGILKEAMFNKVNERAAVQQLKLTLRDAQLEFGALDDKFSEILIADALAVEQ